MSLCGCIPWCTALDQGEQLFLEGFTEKIVVNGPGWKCIPCCYGGGKRDAIQLKQTQYIRIRDTISGDEKVVKGPGLYYMTAYEENLDDGRPVEADSLGPTDYLKVIDKQTGEPQIIKGPTLWFPQTPYERVEERLTAVPLKHFEYLKIIDRKTGAIRTERGEGLVYLEPSEEIMDFDKKTQGVKQAVNVDEHTAVLVRNTENGQLRLSTKKELFFPKAHEEIEKIQNKIVLEDHQVVILIDKDGRYIFKEGKAVKEGKFKRQRGDAAKSVDQIKAEAKEVEAESKKKRKDKDGKAELEEDEERSFFLPPYCTLETLTWYNSEDLKHKVEKVDHFDLRPQFMTYEFVCRTCDNVELVIDLTFFWEINDIRKMKHKTDDLPGDICNHARSVIIQDVSQVTLEKFMSEFNTVIAQAVLGKEDNFYDERGAFVHTVEVRSIHCKDQATEKVLQEIIKETTDRLNRLQKQASENEVRLYKMKGDIEEEKLNGELLKIRHDHHRAEALMEGEAEADQVTAFLKGLGSVPFDQQVQMWATLRKLDGIKKLAMSNSQMYFTPNDVNLSIETLHAPSNVGGKKKQ